MATKERSRGGAGVTREAWFLKRCKELEAKLVRDLAAAEAANETFQRVAPASGQFDDGIPDREAPKDYDRRGGQCPSKGNHRRDR